MGKKRKKKSRSRKKRQRQKKKAAEKRLDASASTGAEEEEEADSTADDAEPTSTDEGTPDPPTDVDAVIEVEDDVDPAELIAAAAGLAPSESPKGAASDGESQDAAETGPASDETASSGEASPSDPATTAGETPSAEGKASASDGSAPSEDEGAAPSEDSRDEEGAPETTSAEPEAEEGPPAETEAPLIGPDALVALSEFRREGVATVPEELVLDLGEATSPEERDRLLAAALAHVEMQDAIYRVPVESGTARRWKGLLAATLFLMALFLAGLPPAFLVPEGPQPLTATEEIRGIRQALLFQAEQIEAFRATADRLPRSLSEVETALPGIRFVRSSNRLYQLIAYDPSGEAIVYDSSAPDRAFAELGSDWLAEGDDS